jgi:Asp-tRNA(Asn)/Glu-tRNA(Gln) amidotransferase A subunit family amidase
MTKDLARYALTLIEAAEALAEGELTAVELAEAQLARVAATDAAVDAWTTCDPQHVRAEAARCDGARGRAALRGIGIGVKDIIDTADLPTMMGSAIHARRRPERDATCIARLKASGGYVFGKTVTTPFAFLDPGKTRNPWDPGRTPGGSSSGSAAAVAVGHVTGAIGTQTNGSVVRPAAYCGVVGFKPTLHAIPFGGTHVFSDTLDTLGTFTRTVEDAARLAGTLADAGRISGTISPRASPPRLAYLSDFPWTVLDCDADAVVESAVTKLRTRAEVVPIDVPPAWRAANAVHRTIMLFEAVRNMGELQERAREQLSPRLNAALDEGRAIAQGAYEDARAARAEAIMFFTQWFAGFDAVLAPSAPGPAPWGLAGTGDPACCTLWSLLGFPALNLPVGHFGGLPMGLQLAAPQGRDDALLAVAAWCEARLPFRGLV